MYKHCSVALNGCKNLRISSTDSKVRTTLYSILNSTTGKYCSITYKDSSLDSKDRSHLAQHNKLDKQYCRKVLLGSFHLNGHTLGFYPGRLKRENHLVKNNNKQHHREVMLSSFHLNGHTLGFHPQTQTREPPSRYSIIDPPQHHRKV